MGQISYVEKRSSLRLATTPLLNHLDFELTERCNNACQHCYINLPAEDGVHKARELSTEQWQDIFRQAAELGALSIRFTGGEPLLREDFGDLYLFARRLGLKVKIYTNGRLITPVLANLFSRIPPLEPIEITAYGMQPQSYDAVACATGAFHEFRRGVDLLLDHRIPFLVKGVLLPPNRAEMVDFEEWAKLIPWMDQPPSITVLYDLRARRDSTARNRLIERLRLSPEDALSVLARDESTYLWEKREFCSRFTGPKGDKLFTCGAGKEGSVDAYGQYQPCLLLRDPSLSYSLLAGTLRDALVNHFPRLQEIKATNPAYLARCARCFLHGLCEQCPAKSWMEHGTLDTPVEYHCQVAHVQARYLGLLHDGEQAWLVQDWRQRLALLGNGDAQ